MVFKKNMFYMYFLYLWLYCGHAGIPTLIEMHIIANVEGELPYDLL